MADLRSAFDQSGTPAAESSWMMLDRFVFTEDKKFNPSVGLGNFMANPFSDLSITSLGEYFRVVLRPAAPPTTSRLYVCRTRTNDDDAATEVVTADQGLFLLRITTSTESNIDPYRQDYFVFRASYSMPLLKRLPACIEPIVLPLGDSEISMQRLFHNNTLALVSSISSDEEFEFVVVQLAKFVDMPAGSRKKGAEICVFRSSKCNYSMDKGSFADRFIEDKGKWAILTRPINHTEEEFSDLQGWSTNGAVVFNDCVCWFDYHQGGILLYNLGERFIKYVGLPINDCPTSSSPSDKHLEMYRSLCVTGQRGSQLLRFVDVARDDHNFYGPLRKGCTFTITYYTFGPISHGWHEDAVVVTSRDLYLDGRKRGMPRHSVPMFPLVSRDEPHLVNFQMSEPRKKGQKIDKVAIVVIDVSKKTIVSVTPYIQGDEDLCGKDAEMVRHRSRLPWNFLPVQV